MKIKISFSVIILFASFQISFGIDFVSQNKASNQLYKQTLDDWQLDDSSGIPIWIAWKKEMNEGLRWLIYIGPRNYNLNNLKKVFAAISKQNINARYLLITVMTSKNAVRDEAFARRKGIMSGEDLRTEFKSHEKEDLSFSKSAWYSSIYYRAKGVNRISYHNSKKGNMEMINLKKSITKRKK